MAQGAVVEVEDAFPDHAAHVDIEGVALLDMVVDDGGEQVVCCGDGMEVSGKVQVDVFHGHDLCITAASSTALEAKTGAKGGFAQGYGNLFALLMEGIGKAYAGGRLAFASRGRIDGRHQHQFAVGLVFNPLEGIQRDFGFVLAIEFEFVFGDVEFLRDTANVLHLCALRDFHIGFH